MSKDPKELFGVPGASNTPAVSTQVPGTGNAPAMSPPVEPVAPAITAPVVPATIDAANVVVQEPKKGTKGAKTAGTEQDQKDAYKSKTQKEAEELVGRELTQGEQEIFDIVKDMPNYMLYVSKGVLNAKTLDAKYVN